MNCEEERKLFRLKTKAENNFRSVSLPPATKQLGVETPPGHSFNKERREEIYRAKEALDIAKGTYQAHIKNCPTCAN